MELTKKCTKKNVYQNHSLPFDYTDLNKSKSVLTDEKNVPASLLTQSKEKQAFSPITKLTSHRRSVCTWPSQTFHLRALLN